MPRVECYASQLNHVLIQIRIKDNGPGIDPPTQDRIFDPFFTTKPVGKGTGLGLSISYQIVVDKHKGRLYCESQLGEGTEFVIEIPCTQQSYSAFCFAESTII